MEEGGGEEDAGSKAEQAGRGDYLKRWMTKTRGHYKVENFMLKKVTWLLLVLSTAVSPRRRRSPTAARPGNHRCSEQSDVGGWEDFEDYWLWLSEQANQETKLW